MKRPRPVGVGPQASGRQRERGRSRERVSRKERRRAVRRAVSGYRLNMARLSAMGVLDVWSLYAYAERRPTAVTVPNSAWAVIQKTVAKAKRTTNATLLPKVAQRSHDGGWRFREDPPVLTRVDDETRRKVVASLVEYAEHLPAGLPRHAAAIRRRRRGPPRGRRRERRHPRLSGAAVWQRGRRPAVPPGEGGHRAGARRLPAADDLREQHEGLRVVEAQRLLQALGDPLLGYTKIDGRDYFVRQMKNMKASMPVSFMTGEPFDFWAFLCGALLARAHARYGDAARIAGYCGEDDTLDRALAEFAEAYGDQTERDHAELVKAIKAGRVKAVAGEGDA